MCVGRLRDNPSVLFLWVPIVFLKVWLRRRDEISKNYQMRIATRATLPLIRRNVTESVQVTSLYM